MSCGRYQGWLKAIKSLSLGWPVVSQETNSVHITPIFEQFGDNKVTAVV